MRGNQLPVSVFLQIGWRNKGESAASFSLFLHKGSQNEGESAASFCFFTKRFAK
jgi:hypothetical protein